MRVLKTVTQFIAGFLWIAAVSAIIGAGVFVLVVGLEWLSIWISGSLTPEAFQTVRNVITWSLTLTLVGLIAILSFLIGEDIVRDQGWFR